MVTATRPAVDTEQQRKKAAIERLVRELLDQAEESGWYGEFGVTFNVQNGKVGHYEEQRRRSFK